jgi:membrane protein YqaA with SNARE-associated domain
MSGTVARNACICNFLRSERCPGVGYHPNMGSDFAAALAGLFGSAFLSATLLPGGSEAVLAAVVVHWPERVALAIAVATLGNTLGGLTSFGLGRVLPQPRTSGRALALVRRFGVPALLFSWVPVIGDALCVASGWLRHRALPAAAAIALGKAARYVAVAGAVSAWWGPG